MKWLRNKKPGKINISKKQRRSDIIPSNNQRVISYYTASRHQLDSFERNTGSLQDDSLLHRRMHKIHQLWFVVAVIAVLIVTLGYLGTLNHNPYVSIDGPAYRSLSNYQKTVASVFGHSFKDQIKPLLNSGKLEVAVEQVVPEAQSVVVKSTLFGHRPEVKITTADPLAIFSQPGSTGYIISVRGHLLLPVGDSNIQLSSLPVLQNQTGLNGKAGEQFMIPDEATAFANLLVQLKADDNLSAVSFSLSVTPQELLVHEPGRGYSDKFLLNADIAKQYGALRATEKKLNSMGQTPAEYIDVRLADKVYYK
ncbi:MAG TPA: hypothetical protein VMR51_02285 [Patescibacteria group bacterium]|nr:hypothetical protein [Patescibacteria group bacterium]